MSGMLLLLTSLVVSNGVAVAHCDTNGQVDSWRAHLFAERDATTPTVERMGALYFGVRNGGTNVWLDGQTPDQRGYLDDSGVATVTWERDGLRVTEYLFSSFASDAPHLVAMVEATNTGTSPLVDAAIFSLDDTIAGGDETATWTGGAFEERGDVLLLHRPLGAPVHHGIDPRGQVDGGGELADADAGGPAASLAIGFEWDLDGLAPGSSRTVGVVIGIRDDGDRAALDADLAPLSSDPDQALADARADWDAFFARAAEPPDLTDSERAVYRRSLALLRMAQVREPGAPFGQIVAALHPMSAARAWVRDQSYAARALVRAGLFDEARAALAFVIDAGAGGYQSEIDEPYAISVLRQRGDGSEESEDDGSGPLVGIDGFGLVLGAVDDYVQASGDTAFVSDRAQALFDLTATVLTHRIDVDDTLLVRPDNSVWNGDRRKWTFSQAATVWGLRAAVNLAAGDARADSYRSAADLFAGAISSRLVDAGVLTGALTGDRLDSAATEAFVWGVLPADGDVARATLDAVDQGLRRPDGSYRQNEEAPDEASPTAALWLSMADAAAGNRDRSAAVFAGVTERAGGRDGVVAGADGEAVIGLGAGLYVLAAWERPMPATDNGCGCGGGAPGGGVLLVLLAAAALGRQRRGTRP